MNKRLLAIAIAAGLAVPLTVIAADGAEIYGIAHVAVMQNSGDASTDNTKIDNWASRLGVKGSEDLGGGMKAVYKMEFAVDVADAGTISGRNEYVGLSGGMGTVLLGRHDTPTKMVQGKFDVFNDTIADMAFGSSFSASEVVFGIDLNGDGDATDTAVNVILGGVNGDDRRPSTLTYFSPKMGGMQMIVQLMPGEENGNTPGTTAAAAAARDDTGIADGYSDSFAYEAGSLYVGLGIDGGDLINDQTRLAATYGIDALTVGFLYNVTDTQTPTNDEDEAALGLSAAYKLGDNAIKFMYIDITDDFGIKGADETTITVGYDMNLSARTTAYALYRAYDKADINNYGVGLKHSF